MLLWSVLSYMLISTFVLRGAEVVGSSMRPALNDGDRYILYRWIYHMREPMRGDVIAVRLPWFDELTVKRIVGLPGETILITNNTVLVDGHKLKEPYVVPGNYTIPGPALARPVTVPAGHYILLGDNREQSYDSRTFGPVHRSWITGYIPD
jgi:signal peptidase I